MFCRKQGPHRLRGKAAEIKNVGSAILSAWQMFADLDTLQNRKIEVVLKLTCKCEEILRDAKGDYWLEDTQAAALTKAIFSMFHAQQGLAEEFKSKGDSQLFTVTAKAHYLCHCALQSKFFVTQSGVVLFWWRPDEEAAATVCLLFSKAGSLGCHWKDPDRLQDCTALLVGQGWNLVRMIHWALPPELLLASLKVKAEKDVSCIHFVSLEGIFTWEVFTCVIHLRDIHLRFTWETFTWEGRGFQLCYSLERHSLEIHLRDFHLSFFLYCVYIHLRDFHLRVDFHVRILVLHLNFIKRVEGMFDTMSCTREKSS